jgi:transcriptional regulator with XRE-family HTH domain
MDIQRQVGLNVRKLREKRGWSQEELGYESHLHRTYISGVERGIRNPTISVLQEIAKALDVSPARLLDKI